MHSYDYWVHDHFNRYNGQNFCASRFELRYLDSDNIYADTLMIFSPGAE